MDGIYSVKYQENTNVLVSLFLFTLRENCLNTEFFSGLYLDTFHTVLRMSNKNLNNR